MNILLVTGKKSFFSSPYREAVTQQFRDDGLEYRNCSIGAEPSPLMIDEAVSGYAPWKPDVVVAIGGGSVVDAGKAISAMLPLRNRVKDYLEGVGTKSHPGVKVPFVAIPTTAGTGSEGTKNAVLAETGTAGFKRSLRHENFVPDVAIVDPSLSVSCPPGVSAASGMDAFTQLLESFLSTSANAVTDALALEGLKRIARALPQVFHNGADTGARADMAMAAYLSGITLANAGLGAVHGLAGTIGGLYSIPHGVVCSSLMPAANKVTLCKLRRNGDPGNAIKKYGLVGEIFAGVPGKSADYYADFLIDRITEWKDLMRIPGLSQAGLPSDKIGLISQSSDSKNNPTPLDKDELEEVVNRSM